MKKILSPLFFCIACATEQNPSYSTAQHFVPSYKKRRYQPLKRITRESLLDNGLDEGSLWSSIGQTNYYFIKNKVKDPGESVQLTIDQDLYKEILREIMASLKPHEKDRSLEEYKRGLIAKLKAEEKKPPADPAVTPPETLLTNNPIINNTLMLANNAEEKVEMIKDLPFHLLDISEQIEISLSESIRAEVTARLPNDILYVRAFKKIISPTVGVKVISIAGKIKTADIMEEQNTVLGSKLYDTEIDISG
jgi:hypothetical protein